MPIQQKLPARSEVSEQYTWKTSDLYADIAAWEAEFAALSAELPGFARYEGALAEPGALPRAMDAYFAYHERLSRLVEYAYLRRDEDTADAAQQALFDRALALSVRYETAASFLTPELLSLPDELLEQAQRDPAMRPYWPFLRGELRKRTHTLSPAEERLVAMTGEMGASPSTVYDMLGTADIKFGDILDEDGRPVELTHGRYIPLMTSRTRGVREQAYTALYTAYKKLGNTFSALYNASIKADLFYARTAKYESALAAALFPDELPVSVYDSLVSSVHAHLPALHRYVALYQKALDLPALAMWDIYVPLAQGFDLDVPFEDAFEIVRDALGVLGEQYVTDLSRALPERWVDVYENQGKATGAYCANCYGVHPYVLLNYDHGADEVFTLAHELGHAMHAWYTDRAQPYASSGCSLFTAEVASTVNELLVLDALLKKYPQREAQAFLLNKLLEHFRTTVFRQTMFAEFEREAHEMVEAGGAATMETLNAAYAALNQKYYAPIAQDELIAYEWMRIPHFYRAFYVYKYATGFSAAVALSQAIAREGAPAVARYMDFLRAGTSLSPLDTLKLAGVDMSGPEPVEAALRYFEQRLEQFAALLEE